VEVILRGNYTAAEAAAGEIEQIVHAEPLDATLASRLATSSTAALVVTRRRRRHPGLLRTETCSSSWPTPRTRSSRTAGPG
jgi:hypothetical protein